MKSIFSALIFFVLNAETAFANLYLTTEYQEGNKPKVVTKHHIFLDKPNPVRYTYKKYVLLLKKITPQLAEIEIESYDLDDKGHSEMVAGKIGNFEIGKSFTMIDKPKGNRPRFFFKVTLDKYYPMKN